MAINDIELRVNSLLVIKLLLLMEKLSKRNSYLHELLQRLLIIT